ncbi:hypothetical protein ACCC92_13930 [Mucilaginibacter sp. Mucisp84]|uniref:hypothetical protein n=1 Tax=Mucilaginibacter sp. Mucisp84 TaxID=3243058 RepID=UPI0039A4842D
MRRVIIVILGLALMGFIGTCIYFVAGVSSTIPPIKKYVFFGNVNSFLLGMQKYAAADSEILFKITDTTGNKQNGYGIYMNLEIRNSNSDIEYNLKCEEKDNEGIRSTIVKLIGIHDKNNYKLGGYGIEGIGVRQMVSDFETGFLVKLKEKEGVAVKPYIDNHR